jgi:hypothetical protein
MSLLMMIMMIGLMMMIAGSSEVPKPIFLFQGLCERAFPPREMLLETPTRIWIVSVFFSRMAILTPIMIWWMILVFFWSAARLWWRVMVISWLQTCFVLVVVWTCIVGVLV